MKSRRLGWILATLLVIGISAGLVLAQEQVENAQIPSNPSVQDNTPDNNAPGPDGAPGPDNAPGPNNGPGQQQQDPPGRVARVQYMSGEVSMQPGGVNDWVAATTNRPLTTADRVWTDKNSKAELNVGDGFIRMNSETSLTLTNVGDNMVQLELDQGVLEITVKHLEKGEIYEVDTPNYAFTVMKSGVYSFEVRPNEDQSLVTVRSGYGEATGKGAAVRVNSGQQVRFSGGTSLQHVAEAAPPPDGFEDWAQVRDKRLGDSVSARYVSPGVIGYQDLDAYGVWQNSPVYGSVWVPTSVQPGWAPYRYGHWAWIAPWGWTWVDDAPWGFAPFHYGRWVAWNGGWGWAPGPIGYWNPYYAPALVGWIGGPGFGIGFGFGGGWGFGIGINFGWFPLGWGAPYYPRYCGWGYGGWYHGGGWVSAGYLHNVNVTNTHITNINNITNNYYHGNFAGVGANRNIPGAVTAAHQSAFTSGAAINKVGAVVPKSAVNSGQLLHTANASPTRQSVTAGTSAARAVPPASATNRSVVTRATPPAGPARFNGNQTATARTNGASASGSRAAQGNMNTAHAPIAAPSQGNTAHNVPRPPSAGGTVNNQVARANVPSNPAAHNVPRPPASNDSFARGNTNTANDHGTVNASPHGTSGATTARNSSVPRPPANYTYHAPSGPAPPSAQSHQSSPSQHAAPQGNSHGSSPHGSSQGNSHGSSHGNSGQTSRAFGSVPRPPSGYSYHAAPAYSASSSYAAGRMGTSGYAGNRGGSYPSYGSSRSYGSSPAYSARSYGSSPTYMSRNYGSGGSYSAPHYSAPHNSGGGGGYHGGGGGGHAGGGGGGHSGGGGHR